MTDTVTKALNGNGRRWYDAHSMLIKVSGVLGFVIIAISGVLWGRTVANGEMNATQNVKIERVETTQKHTKEALVEIKATQAGQDEKLEAIRYEQMQQRIMLEKMSRNP